MNDDIIRVVPKISSGAHGRIDYRARYFVMEDRYGERIVVDRWDHVKKYKRIARGFVNYTRFLGHCYYKHITLTQAKEFYKPNLLNNFFNQLRRRYGSISYIWTSEVQEQRLEKYGEAVLHWHVIVAFPMGVDINSDEIKRMQGYWKYGNLDVRSVKRLNIGYILKYITKSLSNSFDFPYRIMRISMSRIPSLFRHTKANIIRAIEWSGYNLDRLFSYFRVDRKGIYCRYFDDLFQKWRKDYMLFLSSWQLIGSYDGEPF